MRFRLLDSTGRVIHEGLVPRQHSDIPAVLTWGAKAFLAERGKGDVVTYKQTTVFDIGSIGFGKQEA